VLILAADFSAGSIGGPMLTVIRPGLIRKASLPRIRRVVRHRHHQGAGAHRQVRAAGFVTTVSPGATRVPSGKITTQ
jgi:hypothetical protein